MSLKLYNTLTSQKEEFIPLQPKKIRMYVCGVTVYDKCHLGHARANVAFDVIYRYLKHRFPDHQIEFVRNFTDVDDKIIQRSNEQKIPWQELTEKYIAEFHNDMRALGNGSPTLEPKATEHIPQMLQLIQKLIDKGIAYTADGDVFYRVKNFKDYGKLSGKNIEDLESGARVDIREAKENPLDFVLWKAAKPDEPSWDSPWGKGRPGWHIECSAMGMKYLGESFDIHGGGRDLIFPHHENEIAQSEGATGKHFVKYWLHNGFVNINAEKMSKSLGNFFSIQDILKQYDWEVVRAFLLSVHYRSPIDFSDQNLHDMGEALERYYTTIKRVREFLNGPSPENPAAFPHPSRGEGVDLPSPMAGEGENTLSNILSSFQQAMDDDFNTAAVFGLLFESVREVNKMLDQIQVGARQAAPLQEFLSNLEKISSVLGCFQPDAAAFFSRTQTRAVKDQNLDESKILQLIEERKQARLSKNWKRSDEIRNELAQMNIVLKDKPDGSVEWSVKG
ncbi:MAG: cysteine--tRNA ligase [Deltaproteobacteria bacterium]|nr:cysteine--tRNA ligase [Deltaproteobacteria bacterium]